MAIQKKNSGDSQVSTGKGDTPVVDKQVGNSMGVSVGRTVNRGDYNSLRVDVWVNVPCGEGDISKEVTDLGVKVIGSLDEIILAAIKSEED